jgi:hypothetical protein
MMTAAEVEDCTLYRLRVKGRRVGGELMVHRTPNGSSYTVTHIRSGLRLVSGLTKAQCIELGCLLKAVDWKFTAPAEMTRAASEKARVIVDRFLEALA